MSTLQGPDSFEKWLAFHALFSKGSSWGRMRTTSMEIAVFDELPGRGYEAVLSQQVAPK